MYRRYNSDLMKQEAFKKMRSYCIYQRRSHKEVKEKLYALGLWRKDVEEVLSQLIEEQYINEEKFANNYAAERFRRNNWGRMKIQQQLKQRQISEACINAAMKKIDEESYMNNLHSDARQRWDSIKGIGCNLFVKMRKTSDYLLQKGYESKLVYEAIQKIRAGEI